MRQDLVRMVNGGTLINPMVAERILRRLEKQPWRRTG
jgi:hypothetical protein